VESSGKKTELVANSDEMNAKGSASSATNEPLDSEATSVSLGKGRKIYLDWDRAHQKEEKIENRVSPERTALRERTAIALANEKKDDISKVVNFLARAQYEHESRLRELKQNIQNELEKHHRLIIHGQITNAGGSPFSIMNKGKVRIYTNDYTYSYVDEEGIDRQFTYTRDTVLDVSIGDAGGDYVNNQGVSDSPILVASGQAKRFVAVSDQRIRQIDQHEGGLQGIFKQAERQFFMGVMAVLPTGKQPQAQYTRPRQFKNFEENEIPMPTPR
jgi:hypothetical protein